MLHIKVLTYCIFSTIANLNAARILGVFPTPSFSHQVVFRPLIQELARRGHEVIVITPDPAFPKNKTPANLTEIDVHDISYNAWRKELMTISVGSNSDMNAQVIMFIHLLTVVFEHQLYDKQVQELIANTKMKFDLILTEACVRPALVFSHLFKAPVIQLSSFGPMLGTNENIGAPNHPLLQPLIVRQRIYNLTMWEKIREIYRQFRFNQFFNEHEDIENAVLKNIFGPSTPTVGELMERVEMVFLNVHPIWNDNSPVPPNLIYMGGVHQQPVKELPKDILRFLESSKNGTIYVSFGTNVQSSMVPPHTIDTMIKVLSQLPYDVLLKWDTNLPNKPKNIKVLKWFPQSDLLKHPKVKLFITQGGLQSTDEAITGGVPLIAMPVIADQWFNAEKYIRLGIGKKLEMGQFNEEEFRSAVVTVIEDNSYRDNILRLRTIMRDELQTPLERATWWVEYVLRHGGARHLRSPAANMSWQEYYEVKLVFTLLTCSILTISACILVLRYIIYRFVSTNNCLEVKLKVK